MGNPMPLPGSALPCEPAKWRLLLRGPPLIIVLLCLSACVRGAQATGPYTSHGHEGRGAESAEEVGGVRYPSSGRIEVWLED